jgi:hypothetical protein
LLSTLSQIANQQKIKKTQQQKMGHKDEKRQTSTRAFYREGRKETLTLKMDLSR